jgi:hypothetical protein
VGLCGYKIATECFQEIAGFGTSLLLRVESFTGGKMAGGRMYAVSASALCDAGIVGVIIFLIRFTKRIQFPSVICYK